MVAFKIIFSILYILLFIIATSVMIIFERDKPRNIIFWLLGFLTNSIVTSIIYLIFKIFQHKKQQSLAVKQWEDEVFVGLNNSNLHSVAVETTDDFYSFNNLVFNTCLTKNNSYEIFSSYEKFKTAVEKELGLAKKYIMLELTTFGVDDFSPILSVLASKAQAGVVVKLVHDKRIKQSIKKQLKTAGVKIYKFSKWKSLGSIYSNRRNVISIDGETVFVGGFDVSKRQMQPGVEVANTFFKFKGDVVQPMNVAIHQDMVFASGKYIELSQVNNREVKNNCTIQFVANKANQNVELLLIKAICSAKTSIQLQLEEFIPTESIMALLKYAIHSNIDVRLMVPLKTTMHSKYFASRAYAKELALEGANVYLYDGFIKFNSIIVDNKYALCGAFSLNRENVATCLQNVIILEGEKAISNFNKKFDLCVNNSYRINNAKYMLLREKFFKNFV